MRRWNAVGAPSWHYAPVPTTVYQYPKCSTCRTALKWLDERGVKYQKVDLVATPPTLDTLRDLHRRSGVPITKMFNTTGESYRAGNFKQKLMDMSEIGRASCRERV